MREGAEVADTVQAHPVKRLTGFTLAKTCKAHRGNIGEMLAEHGLHAGQEMVLVELWQEDGLRGGELATRLGVEPPTITKMLRRLEDCGLVERRPDLSDARSFRVYLTSGGRALEEPVAGCWAREEERLLDGMNAEERRMFHKLLGRARANLEQGSGKQ